MEHTVCTVYGDSQASYGGHLWVVPMQGIFQGNGAGPMLWAVVSTPVLQVMRSEGFGTFFKTCITGHDIRFVGYSFVDDTDLIQTAKTPHDTEAAVALEMQRALDTWEGAIRATGGAIIPDKSFWYLIGFQWHEGQWAYKEMDDAPAVLSVKDCDGHIVQLERLPPNAARRTLGVRLAPDGNNVDEIKHLQSIAETWKAHVHTGHLQHHEAWYALTATIMKTIEYPLLALTLTARECAYIMAPILMGGLPACGICQNFPRDVVYAPNKFMGISLHNIFILMGLLHVEILSYEGKLDFITGNLLRASIEATKLEMGLGQSLFQHLYKHFGHLPSPCWITHTWKFMSEFDIKMTEDTSSPPLRRIGDKFLTAEFFLHGFKGKELARLNRCRLFLQANSMADIAMADGKWITYNAWYGHFDD